MNVWSVLGLSSLTRNIMGIFKDKFKAVLELFKPSVIHLELSPPLPKAEVAKSNHAESTIELKNSLVTRRKRSTNRQQVGSDAPNIEKFAKPAFSADIVIDEDAKVLVSTKINRGFKLLPVSEKLGIKKSIHLSPNAEKREISLGLDFGTSSVKVVIGDHGTDQSYAVPFLVASGMDTHLLPSRVFINSQSTSPKLTDYYKLEESEIAFRDLKLGLLGSPLDRNRQIRVIAFLALVIHRSRSWLFMTHAGIYKNINCLWRLRVGLPAASSLDNALVPIFSKIAQASWLLAGLSGNPTVSQIEQVHDSVFDKELFDNDLEVEIIPEIAAQIYGFVVSTSFDKKAANRFLMVDVGAGTVDASLFKVSSVKGGKFDFEFYTAIIQPFGVSNLHAERVKWWLNNIPDTSSGLNLKKHLIASKYITDLGHIIPDECVDYLSGIHFKKIFPNQCDEDYFKYKLSSQVRGSAVWRAYKDGYLTQSELKDIPMFLCGGGSRAKFYSGLEKLVQHPHGFSWLSVKPLQLNFPRNLIAESILNNDFDRLSVAYGLSRLEVGKVTKALPSPVVSLSITVPFDNRFIDKDQC
jgi:hypothetical protein